MGARQKLNTAYFNGALLLSAFVGLATESFALFLIALAVSLAGACHSGDIRPNGRGPSR